MNPLVKLGRTYAAARKMRETTALELKKLQELEDAAEADLMEALITAQTKSITIEGVGRLTVTRSTYPSVNASSKPLFFTYLKEFGHGGLIKEDVNSQTLNAFLKRHVVELKQQFTTEGVTAQQAELLACADPDKYGPQLAGVVVDEMDADEMAIDLLKAKGAAMFTKQGITLNKE